MRENPPEFGEDPGEFRRILKNMKEFGRVWENSREFEKNPKEYDGIRKIREHQSESEKISNNSSKIPDNTKTTN